ncbi:ATP-binding cassette domain-containing protein [Bacillus sp. AFS041924]|uniref:ATP-binding cassette domain-containing protein n=1 Tax=Bacillus sp. AFS041924 TaxID=2033503 RepID=UPI00159BC5E1|nr:ABC transporter ATP-binding protein [Bacillus sp. AFS041924]
MDHIESKNIIFDYPSKKIFKGMSFKAHSSSITYLAGENGIGKTTWIKMATGRLKPLSGSITFGGKSIYEVREKIAVVLDEPPVYENLNGYENLIALSGIRKLDNKIKLELEENLKLDKFLMNTKAKGFSLGQRHRLAFAAALIRKPRYLILDEPTIGLDPFSWELIKLQLQTMAKNGATILITGHDFEQISEIAENIVIIKDGVALEERSIRELKIKSRRYVQLLVDKPELVTKEFVASEIININNQNYVCIPIIEEYDINSILHAVYKQDIYIFDILIKTPSLKDIYKEIINKKEKQKQEIPAYA